MAGTIADAFVNVALDPKQINSQLSTLGGGLEGRFSKLGGGAGLAMKAGIVGAVAGTAILVGKELYQLGARFDEMADSIQVATGASGKDLEGMVSSAKRVATQVPTSFEDAGKAIGDVRARTGLTGKALEGMTKQMLELSRLTGTDLKKNIELSTRTLGDWGFKGVEATRALDKMFRASQATGVEFGTLSGLLTKFGGPMRQLGFGFDDTTALLAKFEREGVNTGLVMGSMRIALGKIAKASEGLEAAQGKLAKAELDLAKARKENDPIAIAKAEAAVGKYAKAVQFATDASEGAPVAIRRIFERIRDAKSDTEGTSIALEAFGARAGPDMAAAIREGRFSIADLTKTIKRGKGTIVGTGKDTADFAEQWLMFKNKVLVAIAPIAEKFFALMGEGMEWLNEELPPLVAQLEKKLGPTLADIGVIVEELEPVFREVFEFAIVALENFAKVAEGVFKIVGGAIKVVASLLRGDWAGAWEGAKQIVEGVGDVVEGVVGQWINVLDLATTPIRKAAAAIGNAIVEGVVNPVKGIGDAVRGAINAGVRFGEELLGALGERAAGIGRRIVNAIVGVVDDIGNRVRGAINAGITFGEEILSAIASRALGVGNRIVSAIVNGIADVGEAVRRNLGNLISFGREFLEGVAEKAQKIGGAIVRGIWDGIRALRGWLRGKIADLLRGIAGSFGRAAGAIGGALGVSGRSAGPPPAGPAGPTGLAGAGPMAAGGAGGLAGPVAPFQPLRRQLARISGEQAAALPVAEVRVFIGEQELTEIVRTEVVRENTWTAQTLLAGARG
jgi:TP901 family phage tail tape measure protein